MLRVSAQGKLPQAAAAAGVDRVVRIHPEEPVATRVSQRLVPRRREVVAPGEVEQPGAIGLDDPWRFIGRAGVDDHHLINPRPDALQAGADGGRVVADDHAEREPDLRTLQQQPAVRGGPER